MFEDGSAAQDVAGDVDDGPILGVRGGAEFGECFGDSGVNEFGECHLTMHSRTFA